MGKLHWDIHLGSGDAHILLGGPEARSIGLWIERRAEVPLIQGAGLWDFPLN